MALSFSALPRCSANGRFSTLGWRRRCQISAFCLPDGCNGWGLLAGANTDGCRLPHSIRVGLGVFQGNQAMIRSRFALSGSTLFSVTILSEAAHDCKIISALLEGNTKYLLDFLLCGNIIGVNMHNVILPFFLDLSSSKLLGIAGAMMRRRLRA